MIYRRQVVRYLAHACRLADMADDPNTGGADTWIGPDSALVHMFATEAGHDPELLAEILRFTRPGTPTRDLVEYALNLALVAG